MKSEPATASESVTPSESVVTIEARKKRGIALMKAGQKTEAKLLFQEVVALEPTHEAAWLHLAALANNAAEAFTALNVVRKLNANHASIPEIERWILEQWPDQITQLEADDAQPKTTPFAPSISIPPKLVAGWTKLKGQVTSVINKPAKEPDFIWQNWGLISALLIGILAVCLIPLLGIEGEARSYSDVTANSLTQELSRLRELVALAQNEGDQKAAIDHLELMYTLAPEDEEVIDTLAESHYRQGISLRNAAQFEAAQKSFNRALTIQETMDNALLEQQQLEYYLSGIDYYQEGKWSEAIEALETVYEQSPRYPSLAEMLYSAYFNQGVALEANRDLETALGLFNQAQTVLPNMPEAPRKIAEVTQLLNPPTPTPAPTATLSITETVKLNREKRVVVDISEQQAYTYQGDSLVHQFVVSTGEPGRDTAIGEFKIQNKIPVAYASTWNLDMPFWLGIYWAGPLQNGFHALPTVRHTGRQLWDGYLGQRVSYGCVILSLDDAEILYDWVEVGTPVTIQW